jgi:hypothetical protein
MIPGPVALDVHESAAEAQIDGAHTEPLSHTCQLNRRSERLAGAPLRPPGRAPNIGAKPVATDPIAGVRSGF